MLHETLHDETTAKAHFSDETQQAANDVLRVRYVDVLNRARKARPGEEPIGRTDEFEGNVSNGKCL